MSHMTTTKARDLQEGDLIDLESAAKWLRDTGAPIHPNDVTAAEHKLSIVLDVVVAQPDNMGDALDNYRAFQDHDVAAIHTLHEGVWVILAGFPVPVTGRT